MKIAILTQPLGHNYGGLLQAYAMQVVLRDLGIEPETIDRQKPVSRGKYYRDYGKYFMKKIRGRIKTIPTDYRKSYIYSNLAAFRSQHLKMSPTICSSNDLLRYCETQNFDGFLVGSDQVWRPRYSPYLPNFFLDFANTNILANATKLSYAASFGVDQWEYSDEQTATTKVLAQRFDAISVREKSGVTLCREYLDVEAEWVLDPTMLLPRSHYEALIKSGPALPKRTGIMCYVLDESIEKLNIILEISTRLKKEAYHIKPLKSLQHTALEDIDCCRYPRVEAWLQGISDSEFVVTDSFHGTVFAIIFNKPFVAIGNRGRGLSRFQSLLGLLGLEDRLITSQDGFSQELLDSPIDWETTNKRLTSAVEKSTNFLTRHFKNSNGN